MKTFIFKKKEKPSSQNDHFTTQLSLVLLKDPPLFKGYDVTSIYFPNAQRRKVEITSNLIKKTKTFFFFFAL